MASSKASKVIFDALLAGFIGRTTAMIKAELEKAKLEIQAKLKGLAAGSALLIGALAFILFAIGFLLVAAVAGLSTVWPVWLSALVIGGAVLLIALILLWIGLSLIKKNKDLRPTDTYENIKDALPW